MTKLFNWSVAGGVVFVYAACGSVYVLNQFTEFSMLTSAMLVLGIVLSIPAVLLLSGKFYVRDKKLAYMGLGLVAIAILIAGSLFMFKHFYCADNFVYYCS